MGLVTKAPRGTVDKLPSDIHKYQKIEQGVISKSLVYGFKEIRTPVFEHTELFKRGVGDTTDIVQKEMYTFDDKKGRSLTLKPEGTAPAARSAIENGLINNALPLKLCYITNCYRYEAPQKGRYREFSQFGAEVYGANTYLCDAELISLGYEIFSDFGIPDDCYTIEINSIGCPKCRENYQQKLREHYAKFEDKLCGDCVERLKRNPMRLIDCKNPNCGEFKNDIPSILDYNCDECGEFFEKFKSQLDMLKIPYVVNPKIVRGLDYYTNSVFEFVSKEDGLVFGAGGRYNGLMKELGGGDIPAAGFALGIERLVSVIERQNGFSKAKTPDVYIAGIGDDAASYALRLANNLRKEGVISECDITGRSVKAQMRFADKIGAKHTIVIGDDELSSLKVNLKNMETKEVFEISIADINEIISKI